MINYRTLVSQKLYAIRGKEMLERLESAQFFPAPFSNLFRTEKNAGNFDLSKNHANPSLSNILFPLPIAGFCAILLVTYFDKMHSWSLKNVRYYEVLRYFAIRYYQVLLYFKWFFNCMVTLFVMFLRNGSWKTLHKKSFWLRGTLLKLFAKNPSLNELV